MEIWILVGLKCVWCMLVVWCSNVGSGRVNRVSSLLWC